MYNLIKREAIYLDAPKILFESEVKKIGSDSKIEAEKLIKEAEAKAAEILDDAKKKAENILKQANEVYKAKEVQANKLLEEAQKKIEDLKRSIESEVEQKLRNEYEKKLENQLKQLSKLISEIKKNRDLIIEKLIYKLLEILKLFMKKVSLETVEIDEKLVLKKLRMMTQLLTANQKIVFKLSLEDKDVITEDLIKDIKSRFENVIFKFDDSLRKNDLIVETDFGVYNFTTDEAFNILDDIFEEELSEN